MKERPPGLSPTASNLLDRAVQLLQSPLSADQRDTWLTLAYYSKHKDLYYRIDQQGAPADFTTRCVRILLEAGCRGGRHTLSLLLDVVRSACGVERQPEFDALVAELDKLCTQPPEQAGSIQSDQAAVSDQRSRELAYLDRLQLAELQHTALYTPLSGIARPAVPLRTVVMHSHDYHFGHDKRTTPMPSLDKSNIQQIVDLLTPLMERENERRALLILALGHDALLLRQLDLPGAVEPFLVNMIKALVDYGEVAPGKQALWALLEVVWERVGVDRQAKISALYPVINVLGRNDDQGLMHEETDSRQKTFTGELLSLNFQNIDLRALLQIIADFTGQNVVVSDTVQGNLTLHLQNVPWDQALDIILRTKGLTLRQNGNVMYIAPTEEVAAREKLELEARKTVTELIPRLPT